MARTSEIGQPSQGWKVETLLFYENNANFYASQSASIDLTSLYERFLPLVPKGGRILDVGCGGGRDLRAFSSRGFECVGLDPSSQLARIAHNHSGCEVIIGRVEELDISKSFDAVWACASLLHIPTRLLPVALRRIRKALKSSGIFFISLQEGEGEIVAADGRFFSRYSAAELQALVTASGFAILSEWITDDALQSRKGISWINILARRSSV